MFVLLLFPVECLMCERPHSINLSAKLLIYRNIAIFACKKTAWQIKNLSFAVGQALILSPLSVYFRKSLRLFGIYD